jgi:hypothetical protein
MCLGVALHEASFLVHAFAEPAIVWFPFLGNKQTVRFPEGDQCGYIVESWPASIRSAPHQDTRASYHQAIGVAKPPSLTIHPPRIRCSGQQHSTSASAQRCALNQHAPDSAPYTAKLPRDAVRPEDKNSISAAKHAPSRDDLHSNRRHIARERSSAPPLEHRPSVVPRSRVHGWTLGSSRSLLSHAGLCCAATNPDRHHDQRHKQG